MEYTHIYVYIYTYIFIRICVQIPLVPDVILIFGMILISLEKAIRYYPDIHEKESIIFQGFVNVVVNGDFEHQLENVSVGDCIFPKSWVVQKMRIFYE